MKKNCLVLGGAGTIGHQFVKRLKSEGNYVRAVDIKYPEFSESVADEFFDDDLRDDYAVRKALSYHSKFDEVYAFQNLMGGALYIFSKENDANIIYDNLVMNLNIAKECSRMGVGKLFFSSSACAYGENSQMTTDNKGLKESDAWQQGKPDSVYGIEKLAAEEIYDSFRRNKGLNIRIGRFHNIFSEEGVYKGGLEKAPAAICRKVAEAKNGTYIEIYGDGKQTRSFLYIQEAYEAVQRLMESSYILPLNIGSDEMISINDLAKMVIDISGKDLKIKNVESNALGVRGRNSNNDLIKEVLNWSPSASLRSGMEKLYEWVLNQTQK